MEDFAISSPCSPQSFRSGKDPAHKTSGLAWKYSEHKTDAPEGPLKAILPRSAHLSN